MKRLGALRHSNDGMTVPSDGYSASHVMGSAYEVVIYTYLNHMTFTSALERDLVHCLGDHSIHICQITLQLTEAGPAGQPFTLFVPVEAYRQVAELAGDLSAGAAVLVTGKLKWTSYTAKDGSKKTNLAVLARLIKVLAPAVETST